ncbi:MAG: hypothetical protein JNL66_09000 [Alphaproteobacteria bacterium]|nr:hypothetical protein [Alphaproteobacteria bacterium]
MTGPDVNATVSIGVLTGMGLEAALVREAAPHASLPVPPRIECSGGTAAGARAAAARLLAAGCSIVVSYGFAGGLDPKLQPGTIVVPERVVSADGASWTIDRRRCDRLASALADVTRPVGTVARGTVYGSDVPLLSVADKRAAHAAHGAVAVDMESHVLAQAATQAERTFMVLRVVLDPANHAIPPAALAALRPDGGIAIGALLGALARRPFQIPALVRLAGDSRRARAALSAASAAALRAIRDL